jgi:RNA polymerase sigma-70 factor (ECF subfamily)
MRRAGHNSLRGPRGRGRIQPVATRSIPVLTDEQVVQLLKKGDRKAGDIIVQRHNRLVARAVYEVVKDLAAVEDLIQEIFMKAFRKIHLYDPAQGKFTVWLTTVARHEAINHLRRLKRSRHVSLDDTAPEGGFSPIERPSQQVSKKETWGKVIEAIHKLPEPARTILIKRILESKPFDQIAKLLKQPVDTVKTIYYRNTEGLRKKLGIPGL